MKSFAIFLIVLAWTPPSVSKNINEFDKYVDFLVNHISGEVMICQDSGNGNLTDSIIGQITRKERTGLITIVDTKNKHNRMECPRCNWFVTLHKTDTKVSFLRYFPTEMEFKNMQISSMYNNVDVKLPFLLSTNT
jgi:hypothetical protein